MVWIQVEDALEEIIWDYEGINHIISFCQDEKIRNTGLKLIGKIEGIGLELGSGPGNFTSRLIENTTEGIVSIDYSIKMIKEAKNFVTNSNANFLRGTFESIPIRSDSISLTVLSYALRDSKEKIKVINNVKKALKPNGKLLIIDIGKPNNKLIDQMFSLYLRYIVPILSGLASGRGYRNPWSLLYKTYEILPQNQSLLYYLRNLVGTTYMKEYCLGG